MILSNVEIFAALDARRLIISPEPTPRAPTLQGNDCPFDTHTVDLRLGNELSIPSGGTFAYDHTQPGQLSRLLAQNSSIRRLEADQPYRLDPQNFVLGITLESVGLPINPALENCLAARIEGKSSRARCGLLVHFTAPTVHPGWSGPLVLEMINLGHAPILLTPGMYIAQLIVEEVRGIPRQDGPSEFQGQTRPDGRA
jgi:dCTP deaminase